MAFIQPQGLLWNRYPTFRRELDVAVLDPSTLEVVYMTNIELDAVTNNPQSKIGRKVIAVLNAAGIRSGKHESWLDGLQSTLHSQGQSGAANSISGARIVLTDKCNMTCSYCFVDTNSGQDDITDDDLRDGLEFLFSSARGRPTFLLQWFGGEPTLRFDLIQKGDAYARKFANRYGISRVLHTLVTNGYRIRPEMIAHFRRYHYGVGISIDGFSGVNHHSRTLLSGRNVDDEIEANIRNLVKVSGISTGINITPNSYNIEHLESSCIYAMDMLGVKFLYFNTPIAGCTGWQIDGIQLALTLAAIRRQALMRGCMSVSSIERAYQAMDTRKPSVYEYIQSDGSSNVALLPRRRISLMDINWKSQELIFQYDFHKLTEMFGKIRKNVGSHTACHECFAIGACGGPSLNDSLLKADPCAGPDPQYCGYIKTAFVNALWDATGLQ